MTVLGSARPLSAGARALPRHAQPRAGARPITALPRRRTSRATRAYARSNLVRGLIGVVLMAFLIGLIYLAQAVSLGATNYEIGQLVTQRDDLYRQVQTAETSVLAWGTEPTVLDRAQHLGLDQLPARIRIAAR